MINWSEWREVFAGLFSVTAVIVVGVLIIFALYPLNHLEAIFGGMIVIVIGIASIFLLIWGGFYGYFSES